MSERDDTPGCISLVLAVAAFYMAFHVALLWPTQDMACWKRGFEGARDNFVPFQARQCYCGKIDTAWDNAKPMPLRREWNDAYCLRGQP